MSATVQLTRWTQAGPVVEDKRTDADRIMAILKAEQDELELSDCPIKQAQAAVILRLRREIRREVGCG